MPTLLFKDLDYIDESMALRELLDYSQSNKCLLIGTCEDHTHMPAQLKARLEQFLYSMPNINA